MGVVPRQSGVPANKRGVGTREVMMGVWGAPEPGSSHPMLLQADWVLAPDSGVSVTRDGWASEGTSVTGHGAVSYSAYQSSTVHLSWSLCDIQHVRFVESMYRLCGTPGRYVTYLDPSYENVASALLARPGNLVTSFAPAAWKSTGEPVASVTRDGGIRYVAETVDTADYDEFFVVPETYRLRVNVTKVEGNRVEVWQWTPPDDPTQYGSWGYWRVNSGGFTYTATNYHRLFRVRVGSGRSAGEVSPIQVAIVPPGAPLPTGEAALTMPAGFARLRPVPGSFEVTEQSAPLNMFSCSIELKEVWPWE